MSGKYDQTFKWDPASDPEGNTAKAIAMWKEGLSGEIIANRIGHPSRNGVIGKLFRLGYSGRKPSPAGVQRKAYNRKKPKGENVWKKAVAKKFAEANAKPKKATDGLWEPGAGDLAPAPRDGEAIEVPAAQRKQLADLEAGECRFPYGDIEVDRAGFYFCGGKTVPGLPYCEAHARCCYQPPNPNRRPVDRHRTGFSMPPQRPRIEHEEAADGPAPLSFEDA
jgi:GcrA cell cycle regulator